MGSKRPGLDQEQFWHYVLSYWLLYEAKLTLQDRSNLLKRTIKRATSAEEELLFVRKAWWRKLSAAVRNPEVLMTTGTISEGDQAEVDELAEAEDDVFWFDRERQELVINRKKLDVIFPDEILRKEQENRKRGRKINPEGKIDYRAIRADRVRIYYGMKQLHNMAITAPRLTAFQLWQEHGKFDLRSVLDKDEQDEYRSIVGMMAGVLQYRGCVLAERRFRKYLVLRLGEVNESNADLTVEKARRRAKRIIARGKEHEEYLAPKERIIFPPVHEASWLKKAEEDRPLDQYFERQPVRFISFCTDIIGQLCAKRKVQYRVVVSDESSAVLVGQGRISKRLHGILGFVIMPWLKGSDAEHRIRIANELHKRIRLLASERVQWIILCANGGLEGSLDAVRVGGESYEHFGNRVVYLDWSLLRGYASIYPWLWSKLFGDAYGFRVFGGDDSDRICLELCNGRLARVMPLDRIVQPTVLDDSVTRSRRINIIGKPGSGKSVAIYQLLKRRYADAVAFIVAVGHDTKYDSLLLDLVKDTEQNENCTVVVFDDVQYHIGSRSEEHSFRTLASRLHNETSCRMLFAFWSSEKLHVEHVLGHEGPESISISLDHPPVSLLQEIVSIACHAFAIQVGGECLSLDAITKRLCTWDDAPMSLVSALYAVRGKAMDYSLLEELPVSGSFWGLQYRSLLERGLHDYCRALQVLGLLSFGVKGNIPVAVVSEAMLRLLDPTSVDVASSFALLIGEGWLEIAGDCMRWHEVQLAPARDAAVLDASFIERFIGWVMQSTVLSDEHKRFVVRNLGEHLSSIGQYRSAAVVYGAGLGHFSNKADIVFGAARSYVALRDVAAAMKMISLWLLQRPMDAEFSEQIHEAVLCDETAEYLSFIDALLDKGFDEEAYFCLQEYPLQRHVGFAVMWDAVGVLLDHQKVELSKRLMLWRRGQHGYQRRDVMLSVAWMCIARDYENAWTVLVNDAAFLDVREEGAIAQELNPRLRLEDVKLNSAIIDIAMECVEWRVIFGERDVLAALLAGCEERASALPAVCLFRGMMQYRDGDVVGAISSYTEYLSSAENIGVESWVLSELLLCLLCERDFNRVLALVPQITELRLVREQSWRFLALLATDSKECDERIYTMIAHGWRGDYISFCKRLQNWKRWNDCIYFCSLLTEHNFSIDEVMLSRSFSYSAIGNYEAMREDCIRLCSMRGCNGELYGSAIRLLLQRGYVEDALNAYYMVFPREGHGVLREDIYHQICSAIVRSGRIDLYDDFQSFMRSKRKYFNIWWLR